MDKYLEVGKIVSTHGIRGQLRVDPWCDTPQFLCQFKKLYSKDGNVCFDVTSAYVQKRIVIITIKGVDTVEKAEQMRGKILYIDRDDITLEEGTYFIKDLLGLKVIDVDTGLYYGKLTDVFKTGANDVYQVTSDTNKNHLIPAIDEVIIETDIKGKELRIRPIKGLFDDED